MAVTWLATHGVGVSFPEVQGGGNLDVVDGRPWTDLIGLRQGVGTTFQGRPGQSAWFHFPLGHFPVLRGVVPTVTGMRVAATVTAGARVADVHLREGQRVLGRASGGTAPVQSFTVPTAQVRGEVNVSVRVVFDRASRVTFSGAGVQLDSRLPGEPARPHEAGAVEEMMRTELMSTIRGRVRFSLDHGDVPEPAEGDLQLQVMFSPDRQTLRLARFEPIVARAGDHTVTIRQTSGGSGTFNPATGSLTLPLGLHFELPPAADTVGVGGGRNTYVDFDVTTGATTSPGGRFTDSGTPVAASTGACRLVAGGRFREGRWNGAQTLIAVSAPFTPSPR